MLRLWREAVKVIPAEVFSIVATGPDYHLARCAKPVILAALETRSRLLVSTLL